MITELLEQRNLPELLLHNDGTPVTAETWERRRLELIDVLAEHQYGHMPAFTGSVTSQIVSEKSVAAGNAARYDLIVTFPTPFGERFTFPACLTVPVHAEGETLPLMVYIAFRYDEFYPLEEILGKGIAVASFLYQDVPADREDNYQEGIAPHYIKDGVREPNQWGKIGMWAFAASRLLDAVIDRPFVDRTRIGVIGHSRLGKTAAWAAANDTRFTHAFSNNSGCSGIALTRGKVGEKFPRIASVFPYWFCENMQTISVSVEASESTPFDQHFLAAAIAPRKLYAGSALRDSWADGYSEYLSLAAASPAWELLGCKGFLAKPYLPQPGDQYTDGSVAYHLREGIHYLSREDWMKYIEFLKK